MGISNDSLYGLLYAKQKGVDFSNTATIGRQSCHISPKNVDSMLKGYDSSYSGETSKELAENSQKSGGEIPYSEPLFRYLGAETTDSVDFSDYEGATILHDMNKPIGEELKNKFSVVIDGGALEHVFNYPVAIKNCMDMVKVGGHLMLITPGNNWFGHGFYQFSPELFFSLLDEVNGYSTTSVIAYDDKRNWYFAASPKAIKKRVELKYTGKIPLLLTVIAKKTRDVPEHLTVQQSDYVDVWDKHEIGDPGQKVKNISLLRKIYRNLLPKGIRVKLYPIIGKFLRPTFSDRELFTPFDKLSISKKNLIP